jgi:hypothetical protein
VEGAAEVGEAAVADLDGGFADIAGAGAEEIGGAVDAGGTEPETEGAAFGFCEGAAEIGGAAADGGGEVVEGGRVVETAAEDLFDAFGAIVGDALGSGETRWYGGTRAEELEEEEFG